jgi:hypothetical protein
VKTVKASLSDHAHAVLTRWMQNNGVTYGSFLEALAELIEETRGAPPDAWIGKAPSAVARAQEIATERRRR